jgi:hypothetical protein
MDRKGPDHPAVGIGWVRDSRTSTSPVTSNVTLTSGIDPLGTSCFAVSRTRPRVGRDQCGASTSVTVWASAPGGPPQDDRSLSGSTGPSLLPGPGQDAVLKNTRRGLLLLSPPLAAAARRTLGAVRWPFWVHGYLPLWSFKVIICQSLPGWPWAAAFGRGSPEGRRASRASAATRPGRRRRWPGRSPAGCRPLSGRSPRSCRCRVGAVPPRRSPNGPSRTRPDPTGTGSRFHPGRCP